MKWLGRISAADVLTATNGLLGVLAITYILDGEHVIASLLICLAVVMDGLDGLVARRFGTPHEFGRFLDSISDVVSFCLTPALLIYNNFYDKSLGSAWVSMPNAVAMVACMFYAAFGILRLARFAGKDHSKNYFVGLPTPAAALLVVSLSMLWGREDLNPLVLSYELYAVSFATILISFIMVSDIPYPNIRGKLLVPAGSVLALASIPFIVLLLGVRADYLPLQNIELVVFILLLIYVIAGPIVGYNIKKQKRRKR